MLGCCAIINSSVAQELSISAQSNAVQITWSAPAPGFILQSTAALDSMAWSETSLPGVINGSNVVIFPITNTSAFFRLARSFAGCSTNSADEPDMEFRDTDCDGIDGTIAGAIFVSATGHDLTNDGLHYRQPVRTINHALSLASAQGRSSLYLQTGTYFENVDLPSGIKLYGGYDLNWNRGPYSNANHRTVIQGAYHTAAQQWITLRLTGGSSAPNVLQNLVVIGADAAEPGYSSMVLHALNASVDLDTVGIFCGDGADGTNGLSGLDAITVSVPATAGNGGNADELQDACDTTSHGTGGSAGVNSAGAGNSPSTRAMNGGRGGHGGEMDTSCTGLGTCQNCNATAGDRGLNAAYTFGSFGMGGNPGAGSLFCGPGLNGTNGFVANGPGGPGGSSVTTVGNYPAPAAGGVGGTGENGGGGGGGGGSGGCDAGVDSYGAGGGGGGAGGVAARSGGRGGGGAGGSFGIFAINSQIALRHCEIIRGDGGNGGVGGAGGRGQPGGLGGRGGLASGDSRPGGNGGDGAHGGHGGGGGGGAGGFSVGVALRGSGYSDLGNNIIVGGNPGQGGQGGLSAPNAAPADRDGINGFPGATGLLNTFYTLPLGP